MIHNTPFSVAPKQRRGRTLALWLIPAVAGAAIGVAFLRDLSAAPLQAAPAVAPALTVTLSTPQHQIWPETIEASGAITAFQETIIGAQIGGIQLREVHVNVGDRVKKGQVLATFDPATPRAELMRLIAALEQAEAAEAQARANRARAESLAGSGAISDQEVLRYVTEADSARASTRAARAALETQSEQLRYVEVRAPEDGVIVSRSASPGAVGGVGTELFRLIPQERLEWRGELTAEQLSRVSVGQTVELSLPDGAVAQARLRQTAPSLDPVTRMGLIYADVTGRGAKAGMPKAGMYAGGRIQLSDRPALTVPAASLVLRDGRHYLFEAAPKGPHLVVKARAVTPGRYQGAEVEILNTDLATARIVVTGAGFLKDGDIVSDAQKKTQKKQGPAA